MSVGVPRRPETPDTQGQNTTIHTPTTACPYIETDTEDVPD